jgi:hypothetical protein
MNKIDEVLKLKELLDSGLINQSDFDRKKKEIFEETNNESKVTNELISSEVHQNIQERNINLFDKRKCPQCGSENHADNNVCIVCKTDLTIFRQPTEPNQEPDIENRQSKYFIPIVLIGLLIISASFFLFKNHQTSPNAEAVQDTTNVEAPINSQDIPQTNYTDTTNISNESIQTTNIIDTTQNLTFNKDSLQSNSALNSNNTKKENNITEEDVIKIHDEFSKSKDKLNVVRDQLLSVLTEKEKNIFWNKQRNFFNSGNELVDKISEKYKDDELLINYYTTKMLLDGMNIRIKEIQKMYNLKK